MEHELSGLYDIAHGAGLAIMTPAWMRYVYKTKVSRFVQFAVNVMGVSNDFTDPEGTAERGIEAMERFYRAINMPTCLSELLGRTISDDEIGVLVDKCSRGKTITVGSLEVLGTEEMAQVYRMANH